MGTGCPRVRIRASLERRNVGEICLEVKGHFFTFQIAEELEVEVDIGNGSPTVKTKRRQSDEVAVEKQ